MRWIAAFALTVAALCSTSSSCESAEPTVQAVSRRFTHCPGGKCKVFRPRPTR